MDQAQIKEFLREMPNNFFEVLKLVANAISKRETAWEDFRQLPLTAKDILVKLYLPVALLAALAQSISYSISGYSFFSSLIYFLSIAVVFALSTLLVGFIINKLSNSDSLGTPVSVEDATKWLAYPLLISTTASILDFVPWLGLLLKVVLGLYSLYFLWLGTSLFLKQNEKKVNFFVASFLTLIIVNILLVLVHSSIFGLKSPNAISAEQLQSVMQEQLNKSLESLNEK
jgi:dolichyl-phosphate-mannose--protein O-mannosyl transferase